MWVNLYMLRNFHRILKVAMNVIKARNPLIPSLLNVEGFLKREIRIHEGSQANVRTRKIII